MKITVDAFWDAEAKVWVAQARDADIGLVTEAETVEVLKAKLPVIARDLLKGEYEGPLDIELVATSRQFVAA